MSRSLLILGFILVAGFLFVSCKDKYYVEDLSGNKLSVFSIFLKQKGILVFVDIVSCHDCIVNLSNYLNQLDSTTNRFEIIGIGISQGTVASKKLIQQIFRKYYKTISSIYYIQPSNELFKLLFAKGFLSPSLVIWNSNTGKFYVVKYNELFDKKGKLLDSGITVLNKFLIESD